jgi:DnaK suppressor protein
LHGRKAAGTEIAAFGRVNPRRCRAAWLRCGDALGCPKHRNDTMTNAEREKYRERLLAIGKRIQGDFAFVSREAFRQTGRESGGNLSNLPLHPADLSDDTLQHEVALGILENEDRILEQIVTALGRMDNGSFGICVECGKNIPKERLEALPYTPHCVSCASKSESEQRP